jgi:tetratricopeptide (TPR) repeat protein
LAWALFDAGEFARAEKRFAELAAGDSEFAGEAGFVRGRALEELGRTAEAIGAYRDSIKGRAPDEMKQEAFYRLAFILPQPERADNLKASAASFPGGEFLHGMQLQVAEGLFAAEDFEQARNLYAAAAKAPEGSATRRGAEYGLAWIALKQGRFGEARKRFGQLRQEKDDDRIGLDATLQLAESAAREERFADSMPLFERLLGDREHGERATYMLAWACRNTGELERARELFAAVRENWPDGKFAADAALRLAEILSWEGKHSAAARLLDSTSFADTPLREDALHALCQALAAERDWKQLLERAEALRNQFPESKRRYLATFHLGRASQELGLADKAEDYFRQTIEETDTVEAAKAQFNIGALRFAAKDYDSAARQFLRVDMLYDYKEVSAKALYHAAEAFRRAGDEERAGMYRERLREAHPESEWTARAAHSGTDQEGQP